MNFCTRSVFKRIKNDQELADGFHFDERIRYNLLLNVALSNKGIAIKTVSVLIVVQ